MVGPRGQGPSKNRQGPGKNNWSDHVPSGLPDKNFGRVGSDWLRKFTSIGGSDWVHAVPVKIVKCLLLFTLYTIVNTFHVV